MKKRSFGTNVACACAALALVMMLTVGAYAADVGGMRSTVDVWLYGSVTEVEIEEISEGNFVITYPDGSTRETGGMAEDGRGGMRGLTMDEILDDLRNYPDVIEQEDGRIMLYIRSHSIDITNQIKEKGYAQEKVKDGLLADYITVKWGDNGSMSISTSHFSFPDPA